MAAPGQHVVLSDQGLVEILQDHVHGRTHPSSGFIHWTIDPYSRRPHQFPNVNRDGSCYYANLNPQNRRTHDGSGYWINKERRTILEYGETVIGDKQIFIFRPNRSNLTSTKWIMIEYTLSSDTLKALCVICMTARNQRNEICVAIPNPLPPADDRSYGEAPCIIGMTAGNQGNEIDQASTSDATNQWPLNYPNSHDIDILKDVAAYLGVEYEASPLEFNDMDMPTF